MREPRIPMLPGELPRQRIQEAVGLEPRPGNFAPIVGYGAVPGELLPTPRARQAL